MRTGRAGLATILGLLLTTTATAAPAEGEPAPRFELPGSDGRVHRLSEHIGKRAVVLAWFPKAFTGG